MNAPAATAVPITPATFGPIACMSRKFVGSASAPTFCETLAAIGTADTPADPMSGLIFPPVSLHISLPKSTPAAVPKLNAIRTDGCSQEDDYDVHERVGSCLLKLAYDSALAEEVSEHEHSDKRCR